MARAKKIVTIDWETWAASGGTAGMFGKNFRDGTLKITEDVVPPINQTKNWKGPAFKAEKYNTKGF